MEHKLPEPAQERIRVLNDQIQQLSLLRQQFVEGVLVGMGVDITKKLKVSFEDMTVEEQHELGS